MCVWLERDTQNESRRIQYYHFVYQLNIQIYVPLPLLFKLQCHVNSPETFYSNDCSASWEMNNNIFFCLYILLQCIPSNFQLTNSMCIWSVYGVQSDNFWIILTTLVLYCMEWSGCVYIAQFTCIQRFDMWILCKQLKEHNHLQFIFIVLSWHICIYTLNPNGCSFPYIYKLVKCITDDAPSSSSFFWYLGLG